MDIMVRGKNIEVTPALVEYANRKLGKLSKFFGQEAGAQVAMSVVRENHIVEVTVNINGLILRGEESTGDMYASIDMVVAKLEKQVTKYKTRLNKSMRNKRLRAANEKLISPFSGEEFEDRKIVKTKSFPLKPMDLEEAILQMNLLGHSFFVFANAQSNRVNVLYQRQDGDYGLIDPEI